jgi:N-acetylglucosamine-6-phosphate deacetylase
LSPRRAGAQDPASLRLPDGEELAGWLEAAPGLPVVCTFAPELPGALELVGRFAGRVVFSIGHTEATREEAQAALAAGARHFTHLFNAMPGLHHRHPGPVTAAFEHAEATAEIIADGVHVHPALVALAARLLGERLVLVTDAMRACGMGDGTFRLYRHDVRVVGGEARLADGTLAGSLLTMDAAVRSAVAAGVPLAAALHAASGAPAGTIGRSGELGAIAAGRAADLVELDAELRVVRVLVAGEEVWHAD